MNNIDKDYLSLCQDILDNGTKKQTRTGTDAISVFGRQIRHKMSDGFPLLTTKKMAWKQIVTELLWFLRGDTNIKYLVDNNCQIWDGDAYENYMNYWVKNRSSYKGNYQKEFINKIKTDDEFAKKWGELGPIYGKQWRSWKSNYWIPKAWLNENGEIVVRGNNNIKLEYDEIDQIANLIHDLKTNPDSRRLMVNAWNVGELDQMVLPPCHYGFQVYTRELSNEEIAFEANKRGFNLKGMTFSGKLIIDSKEVKEKNIPTRAISLMWNQRSVDVPLGLPFNIASYGLLLEIIAKTVNMIPDELIGNLGDCHIYENQIDGIKEQMGRELSLEERLNMVSEEIQKEFSSGIVNLPNFPNTSVWSDDGKMSCLDDFGVSRRTREPYPLPTLNINTEFWPYEGGECGVGPLDAIAVFHAFKDDNFCKCLLNEDIQLGNYKYHAKINIPLSN